MRALCIYDRGTLVGGEIQQLHTGRSAGYPGFSCISFSLSSFSFRRHSLFSFAPFATISSSFPISWPIDIYLLPLSVPSNSSVYSFLSFQREEVKMSALKSPLRFILCTFPALSLCFCMPSGTCQLFPPKTIF